MRPAEAGPTTDPSRGSSHILCVAAARRIFQFGNPCNNNLHNPPVIPSRGRRRPIPTSREALATVQHSPDADHEAAGNRLVIEDLERRIIELTGADESDFGHFTTLDWILCVSGFVVLPYLVFLWFWP
jgi:hypothetical protein